MPYRGAATREGTWGSAHRTGRIRLLVAKTTEAATCTGAQLRKQALPRRRKRGAPWEHRRGGGDRRKAGRAEVAGWGRDWRFGASGQAG